MATQSANWETKPRQQSGQSLISTSWWLTAWEPVERIGCAIGLLAAAPALTPLAGAVAFLSGRSPFVAHERVGLGGKRFYMWKLRTMWDESPQRKPGYLIERLDDPPVPVDKAGGDARVTHRLARWMRRYSLDELPQLLHVVQGRMSLVGPRPLTDKELRQYYGAAVAEILSVKPGLTGLWQVSGRSNLSYAERKALDLTLVRNPSLSFRLRILARTVRAVLTGENAA